MSKLLECSNIVKTYGSKPALRNFSAEIEPGRIVGLLGPNGSGKTTLIKIAAGLLRPNSGDLRICGLEPGPETKSMVSYLPDRIYLSKRMRITNTLDLFEDFYEDFDRGCAMEMLKRLDIDASAKLKTLSKGTQEKIQIILVMSRKAKLYLLDEPIGGVDPAARDFILRTMISNYNKEASIIISTHLIADVESILDDVILIRNGELIIQDSADNIRQRSGKTVDQMFREVFRC